MSEAAGEGTSRSKRKSSDLKRADSLFGAIIRASGPCWGIGKTSFECKGYIQAAHVVSRRYRAARWIEDNCVPLCAAHHLFWTMRPLEWQVVMGDRWDRNMSLALNGTPERARDAVERLRG